jgi:tetratricopeptide (TPR) repeat protein
MERDPVGDYLDGLPPARAEELARVNGPGLAALRGYLESGAAVAFLGAGASAPLYPLWNGLIGELIDAAAGRLSDAEAETCRELASSSPESVVEIVRRGLSAGVYREVMREVLRVRTDAETGRSWTPVQELVCRCAFKAAVTTNYDPGIVNARMLVRPGASATGFTTWEDELGLDQWRTGDVFGETELPILYAHGQHNRPDSIVLATTEYRRAYAGKLPEVLGRLVDGGHLVWIGFSFADQRVAAILREVADKTGTRVDPGAAPRHVAVMSWDPDAAGNDPRILAQRAEIEYGARVVLYPVRDGAHGALATLLASLADDRFPPVGDVSVHADPVTAPGSAAGVVIPVKWMPGPERVEHFTGRAEELARLDRWAADQQVALVGVTAWGGAGKTALVAHWVQEAAGWTKRPGLRGAFGWSFYADPDAGHWAQGLLEWARRDLGIQVVGSGRLGHAVLGLLQAVPLLLVLDGLERVQEGPAGDGFGRLLDGTLREVLAGACQRPSGGLIVLTSRFPFADLETFDGSSARMLEVPPFTPAEGAALLAASGGDWLPENERRTLVRAVDGHALATGVLAGLLAARPSANELATLGAGLAAATRTDARVGRVLKFYAGRLAEADRYLLAAVSLFARPIDPGAVLAVAEHEAFDSRLAGWTPAMVQAAMRGRLAGMASWHPDGTVSAHPLVRDAFRPLVMAAAETAADTALAGMPAGTVQNRADALLVVEVIELLLDADQWQAADGMYRDRCENGAVFRRLPAARLGQRAAAAFVGTPDGRTACATQLGQRRLSSYHNAAGLFATRAGDLTTAREYLSVSNHYYRYAEEWRSLSIGLKNLVESLGNLGHVRLARDAAAESLASAETAGDRTQIKYAHAYLGWLADLAGDILEAEQQFTAADQIEVVDHFEGAHLYSSRGVWWADRLARTARPGPARALTDRNAIICRRNRWNQDVADCDRMLGRLALAAGDLATAGEHLGAAVAVFRDGDYLTELANALADLAEHARLGGDLDDAERHATEAITIAAPRRMVLALSAALAARARIRASQVTVAPDLDLLYQGRDAADAALRLATHHQLAWHELDALSAHALLDEAEGIDHGWAAKANALRARLIPPGLDPDPLATVERLVAAQKAAEQQAADPGPDESED